jgi:hypothetical protein
MIFCITQRGCLTSKHSSIFPCEFHSLQHIWRYWNVFVHYRSLHKVVRIIYTATRFTLNYCFRVFAHWIVLTPLPPNLQIEQWGESALRHPLVYVRPTVVWAWIKNKLLFLQEDISALWKLCALVQAGRPVWGFLKGGWEISWSGNCIIRSLYQYYLGR